VSEVHHKHVAASFPRTILGSRNLAMPFEHVEGTIIIFKGLGDKAKGVVTSPLFSLLFESIYHEFVYLFLLHQKYYLTSKLFSI
jgi:hypothetical protein